MSRWREILNGYNSIFLEIDVNLEVLIVDIFHENRLAIWREELYFEFVRVETKTVCYLREGLFEAEKLR